METTDEQLKQMIKDGHLFNFCFAYLINKGFMEKFKLREEIEFNLGNYHVTLSYDSGVFSMAHKIHPFKAIDAYQHTNTYFGDDETTILNEVLKEYENEKDVTSV